MRPLKFAGLGLLLLLLSATPAAAQAPPPDERAAAQAFADAAKRLVAAAEALPGDPGWLEDCRALRRRPPARREPAARAYLDGLVIRDLIGRLKPDVLRLRSDLANARTAEPALISGRAALRRLGRAIDAIPPGEDDPCAAYRAFARAGYPRQPAREARALSRRLDLLLSPGMERRIDAAADRMAALGISREDAEAFRSLTD